MNSFSPLVPSSMEMQAVVPEFGLVQKRDGISPGISGTKTLKWGLKSLCFFFSFEKEMRQNLKLI